MKSKIISLIAFVSIFCSCDKKEKRPLFDNCGEKIYLDQNSWYKVSCTGRYINDTVCVYKTEINTPFIKSVSYLAKVKNQIWNLFINSKKRQQDFYFFKIKNYYVTSYFDMDKPVGCKYKDKTNLITIFLMGKKNTLIANDTLYFFCEHISIPMGSSKLCWVISKRKGILGLGFFDFEHDLQIEGSFLVPKDSVASVIKNYYQNTDTSGIYQ